MLITLRNIGRIKNCQLELNPLTVVVGRNNTNKTYVAYAICCLLKGHNRNKLTQRKPTRDSHYYDFKITLSAFVTRYLSYLQRVEKELASPDVLRAFFQDRSSQLFNTTSCQATLDQREVVDGLIRLAKTPFESDISRYIVYEIQLTKKEVLVRKYVESSANISKREFIEKDLFQCLDKVLFPVPIVLPAERNSFIMSYRSLREWKFRITREFQREVISSLGPAVDVSNLKLFDGLVSEYRGTISEYPRPLEDFMDFLADAERIASLGQNSDHDYSRLALLIEELMLDNNRITYQPAAQVGGPELKVKVNQDLTIDLHNASSAIKQITPLLLYLRYRANAGDLLIIDEPEMNLHPQSQMLFLEVLAILVNLGIKVFVTTHSPYFMSHLNNLVQRQSGSMKVRRKMAQLLCCKDPRAFLDIDDVGAYELRDGILQTLKDPDYGIRWDTLSDVSSEIQNIYFNIAEIRDEE